MQNNSTVVNVPQDLTDVEALRRTITRLIEEIDKLKGFRGSVGVEQRIEELILRVGNIETRLDTIEQNNEESTLLRRFNLTSEIFSANTNR